MSCCPAPCCPPPCCPPLTIKACGQPQGDCCTMVQLPPVTVKCTIPHQQPKNNSSSSCDPCCPPCGPCCPPCGPCGLCRPCPLPCLCPPNPCCNPCSSSGGNGNGNGNGLDKNGCPKKQRRERRWPQCNFLKPCIDTRIYRDCEAMCISYAGHIPGEQFIHGRNLPTCTTFAKRRLCTYTPYEFVDPDGCCSFCTYPSSCC